MNSISFPAHIKYCSDGEKQIQTVKEHCEETARYASEALKDVGLSDTAYLAGLLHDLGKYTKKYGEYIENVTNPHIADKDKMKRGSVNHTFAGVKYILDTFHSEVPQGLGDLTSEIIAYAIGAHHGLFDVIDENGKNGFCYRQTKDKIFYDEAVSNFHNFVGREEVKERFQKSVKEIENICHKLTKFCERDYEYGFAYGEICRLILSAVIEGDRRSTAEFEIGKHNVKTMSQENWDQVYERVTDGVYKLNVDSPIGKVRRQLSDMCVKSAEKAGGIYRLNIPTGGGKTLTSLRYALKHAGNCGKKRIFFVMPLLAIIEQNANDIRNYVQDNSIILEHHSNVVEETEKDSDELNKRELLTETWDAPIIITTLVQMLYTLFKGKPTSIRRFKSLANSIIVFDEIQTVPNKMLWMFNLAVNFLSNVCNATIVLCSATQPCLEKVKYPMREISDLVETSPEIYKVFERVELIDKKGMTMEELCGFVNEKTSERLSVLVVCNTKNEASVIYNQLRADGDVSKIYLSANQCTEHRKIIINKLKDLLSRGKRVVCISTQVIEAGVDISFACVIRLQAGMDSIVQAAGRCNRHGEIEGLAPVYIVNLIGESLGRIPDIRDGKNATNALIAEHDNGNKKYVNLMSDDSIALYYKKLYESTKGEQGFCVNDRGKKNSLFSLLSCNYDNCNDNLVDLWQKTCLHQGFKLAGQKFEVFDQNTVDVIVPYGFGKEVITHLYDTKKVKYDISYLKEWIEKSKGYTVSVFNYQLQKLKDNSGVTQVEGMDLYVLNNDFYKPDVGLVLESILMCSEEE